MSQSSSVESRVHELEAEAAPPLRAGTVLQACRFAVDWLTAFALVLATHRVLAALLGGAPRFDLAFVTATLTTGVLALRGAYRSLEGPCHVESVAAIVRAVTVAVAGVVLATPVLRIGPAPFLSILLDLPVLLVGMVAERLVMGEVEHRVIARKLLPALIYGAGDTGRLLAQKLLHETSLGLDPVGFVDDAAELQATNVRVGEGESGLRLPVLGSGDTLDAALDRTRAAAVFIAIPSTSSARIEAIVEQVEARRRPVYFVPSVGDKPFASLRVTSLGGIPVFRARRPAPQIIYATFKRAMDIAGSFVLLVAGAPFILVAIVAVRWTSDGPAIFQQERIGLDGKTFRIYKLRTMRRDTAAYAFHPETAADARVTPVGRWLRRTSIDELPQLWNILAGDMSFVGPRPEMPFIVATYNDTQLQRLMVKPGLTGLWQVSPDRAFRIHDNIYYDLYYLEQRCLALDVAIVILTPFMLLAQRAAK